MLSLFTNTPRKAKLSLTYDDGTVQVVDFYVQRLDLKHGLETEGFVYGLSAVVARSCAVTLTGQLDSSASFVIAAKPTKLAPKPKVPSVNASARAVRKTTAKHAQLTARINKTEQALTAARAEKIILDKQLEASRQQLLASAAGTR